MIRRHSAVLSRSRPRVSVLDFTPEEVLRLLRDRLRGRGVLEARLFRSYPDGTAGAWSDLDLVIVQPTGVPFVEGPRASHDLLDLGVPIDIFVYTPEELARLRKEGAGFWRELERTKTRVL